MFKVHLLSFVAICFLTSGKAQKSDQLFKEKNGVVAIEAEHFHSQSNDSIRKWYAVGKKTDVVSGDSDEKHIKGVSGNAYLEILPDTRVTHEDSLKVGVNFSNIPGEVAVLHYKVHFSTPGKYYVWVRTYSSGTEDNGLHVGLDSEWPESGRRLQWCEGKNQWTWESKQRTAEEHCGVPEAIYLMIEEPGEHTISFSMREDGFEFDKWMMTLEYSRPEGKGPEEVLME